jgi:hypothetical protein
VLAFPDADLIPILVNNYFENFNTYVPLLHRPTFERALQEELHHRDRGFASVFLLVCALGARSVDDPRVLLSPELHDSAGWVFFDQVNIGWIPCSLPPSIYDVQSYFVSLLI